MKFLYINEAAEWCRNNGMDTGDSFELRSDETLTASSRVVYAPAGRSYREGEIADVIIEALGVWQECLLWVKQVGVWASDEDWPKYYAARGERGERLSLDEKPAHLFRSSDLGDLHLFVTLTLENSWDAHILPVVDDRCDRRMWLSHDGWAKIHSSKPVDFVLADG